MEKKDWGRAVWYLFHTLAHKLKPEYSRETGVLFEHINSICSNLPCPDCQEHATKTLATANRRFIISSKETLINFLYTFHNLVNKRTKKPEFSLEALNEMYSRANTQKVIAHFINIMSKNANNDRLMMNSFHRQNYMKAFVKYIAENRYKYNL